jgi:hypothetical protein
MVYQLRPAKPSQLRPGQQKEWLTRVQEEKKKCNDATHREVEGFMGITPIKLCQQTLRKQSLLRRPQLPQGLAHIGLTSPKPLARDELPSEQRDQKYINYKLA